MAIGGAAEPIEEGSGRIVRVLDLIASEHVLLSLRARDKLQLLNELARHAASGTGLERSAIDQAVRTREGLGSTGLGQGFALPHARIAGLDRFFGLFARLDRAIEFQAIDGVPVDLVFLLLIPPDAGHEHVQALAAIARQFRRPDVIRELRLARSKDQIYRTLISG